MNCPRCHTPIRSGKMGGVPVHHCKTCQGVLVAVRDNTAFLDMVVAQLPDEITLEAEVPTAPDLGGQLSCPRCEEPMSHGGYMGAKNVFIDRCVRCLVVWIDGDEIEAMARLYARTNVRASELDAFHNEQAESMERRMRAHLIHRT